jgi:hypothetical protein
MNFDMTDGRLLLSGTFYSGFASQTGFLVGQTLTGGTVTGTPNLMSASPTQIESYFDTKQFDVNEVATDAIITAVSFTFENNVARVGRDANGDAEAYAFGVIAGLLRWNTCYIDSKTRRWYSFNCRGNEYYCRGIFNCCEL